MGDAWFDEDTLREMVPELEAEVVALRAALQSLVDATAKLGTFAFGFDDATEAIRARAVAVAVLTGQEPT